MPPEYVCAGRSAACVSPNRSSTSSARRRASACGRWYSRPTSTRFSSPVRFSSTAANCPASPIWLRRASASRTTSRPATSARPPSGSSSVVRIRTPVVLPGAVGPEQAEHGAGRDLEVDPFSAWTSPNGLAEPLGPDDRRQACAQAYRRRRANDTAPGPPSVLTYPGPSPCSNSSTCIAASARPSRSTASRSRCPRAPRRVRGPQRRRQDHRDADRARRAGGRRGRGPLARRAGDAGRPPTVRLHARGARAVPADARAGAARLPRPAPRHDDGATRDGRARAARPAQVVGDRADDRVEALSLGNQQRVQLAAALVHEPDVLRARRAVLGARPDGGRRPRRGAARRGADARRPGRVLEPPARPRGAALRRGGADRPRPGRRRRPIAALRASRARRCCGSRSRVPTPTGARRSRGVRLDAAVDGGVVLELDDGADPQRVLDLARAQGDVAQFRRVEPTLAELFREVVDEGADSVTGRVWALVARRDFWVRLRERSFIVSTLINLAVISVLIVLRAVERRRDARFRARRGGDERRGRPGGRAGRRVRDAPRARAVRGRGRRPRARSPPARSTPSSRGRP